MRDFSAWYHLVVKVTSSTLDIYINGVQADIDSSYNTNPNNSDWYFNSTVVHRLGRTAWGSEYFDGYLADVYFIDGQALDPTSFGAFDDSGVWQASDASGLTFGTNGFHLFDFANESGIGNDSSGNDNDFTVNNLSNIVGNGNWISQVVTTGGDRDYSSSYGVPQMFDNSSTTECLNGTGTSTTWTPTGGLAFSSSFKMHAYDQDGGSITFNWSGGSYTWTLGTDGNTATLVELSSYLTSPLTSITWSTPNIQGPYIREVEVDGERLVDNSFTNTDVLRDVPTNGDSSDDSGAGGEVSGNYCTFNPLCELTGGYNIALSNGNLEATNGGDAPGTMAFGSGKKYFELTVQAASSFSQGYFGIVNIADHIRPRSWTTSQIAALRDTGSLYGDGSTGSAPGATQVGDVYGFAVDVDNQKVFISVNGTYLNSANPASGTGASFTGRDFSNYAPLASMTAGNGQTIVLNTGQRVFNTAAPTGFQALCTTNLPTPTIADGSAQFQAALWTGNSSARSITTTGMSPDWVWIKRRNAASAHVLTDSVRGTSKQLFSDRTNAEQTSTTAITSFNSDGFSLGTQITGTGDTNATNGTYVGWCWDAGSSTVSNTDGDVTSSVRANQTAGFSIVKWTAPTWNGGPQSVGHGLNAAPSFIIAKVINDSGSWYCYHKSLDASNPQDKYISLNDTSAAGTLADSWGTSAPSSTTFGDRQLGWSGGKDVIAYCISPVAGYSAFGSYTGSGGTGEPFVHTGFAVQFLMVKRTDSSGEWAINDATRNTFNPASNALFPDRTDAEDATRHVDLLSNGFKLKNSSPIYNSSGGSYIYMAFASNPFQGNGGLAR